MLSANIVRFIGLAILAFCVSSCSQTQLIVHATKTITKAIGTSESESSYITEEEKLLVAALPEVISVEAEERGGRYKVGEPYEVSGVRYYPRIQPNYSKTGIASWYGRPFHGRQTANGETYNMNELTAAHKTLPMPTMVRVTNLENGRSLVLRVNDRGPFVNGRIIDVSRRAAQLLGFFNAGTAKVRVESVSVQNGGFILDEVELSVGEQSTVQAEQRPDISVETLPPPDGVDQAPATAKNVSSRIRIQEVEPTQMYIQIGAFVDRSNADNLMDQLHAYGDASISPIMVKGTRYYRVRIGPMTSLDVADGQLGQMIHNGFTEARIIVDE